MTIRRRRTTACPTSTTTPKTDRSTSPPTRSATSTCGSPRICPPAAACPRRAELGVRQRVLRCGDADLAHQRSQRGPLLSQSALQCSGAHRELVTDRRCRGLDRPQQLSDDTPDVVRGAVRGPDAGEVLVRAMVGASSDVLTPGGEAGATVRAAAVLSQRIYRDTALRALRRTFAPFTLCRASGRSPHGFAAVKIGEATECHFGAPLDLRGGARMAAPHGAGDAKRCGIEVVPP